MRKAVHEYVTARRKMFQYFGCPDEYPVRPMMADKWAVSEDDGSYFLTVASGKERNQYFIVRQKTDEPLVFRKADCTMVIAIDCVKTAFILLNESES